MKKLILALCLTVLLIPYAIAAVPMDSANASVSISDNATTHSKCRAVWVGTTQSIDLYVNGGWITFQGATAGTLIPVQAVGARKTAASAAPTAGDIVFLY